MSSIKSNRPIMIPTTRTKLINSLIFVFSDVMWATGYSITLLFLANCSNYSRMIMVTMKSIHLRSTVFQPNRSEIQDHCHRIQCYPKSQESSCSWILQSHIARIFKNILKRLFHSPVEYQTDLEK